MDKLKIQNVQALNNYKHNLPDENKATNIFTVVDNLIGLHSARLITPYATLIPRINGFKVNELTNELFINGTLIKLRCMRKTLHTVSLNLAPIVHQSTKNIRLSICNGLYKKLQISCNEIDRIKELVLEAIEHGDLNSKGIEEYIIKRAYSEVSVIRAVIKELWELGTICYINESEYWGKERRVYGLTSRRYPTLDLESMSVPDSQLSLVHMHINCYGPVTEKDISWWSGLPITTIKKCIKSLGDEVIKIAINELSGVFFISTQDLDEIRCLEYSSKITLLAYEDPSLKGYYESRDRYIDPKFYNNLFNSIGEARASILKDGVIIGIWSWDKKRSDITTSLFSSLDLKDKLTLSELVEKTRVSLSPKSNQLDLFQPVPTQHLTKKSSVMPNERKTKCK